MMPHFESVSVLAEPLRIAFLGPLASFSHQAAIESFGSTATLLPQTSFGDAFAALQSNEADYAVIPCENSSNGAVVQTFDLLADREGLIPDVTVCGEYYLSVHHCLLVNSRYGEGKSLAVENDSKYKNITKLYTHPQVWGQCEKFLSKHFKGVERQDVSATSKAAEIVSKETSNDSAAIGSKFAGDHQKLLALAENIEDDPSNTTRFLLLRNAKSQRTRHGLCRSSAPQPTGESRAAVKRKTLISFLVDHNSPGALADALVVFKGHGLNLTTITTRPGGIHSWQYIFFVECQRNLEIHDDNVVERVMQDLQHVTEKCRDLGSWDDQLPSS